MRSCTKTMASKKFITWGLLFILMFLLASEAASRRVLETSVLGNSKGNKGKGPVRPSSPTPATPAINYGGGHGNKQSRKSSNLEGNKNRGPVPPAGPNHGAHLPKTPPGSRT